jgi:phosphoglycolate phosphatase
VVWPSRSIGFNAAQIGENGMPLQGLIFDLDGTLVDTAPDLLHATNHALSLIDRPPVSMAQLRSFVGTGAMNLIDLGTRATGTAVDQQTLTRLRDSFLAYYGDNIAKSSAIFDGLAPLLEQAKSHGLKLGVCTNKVEYLSHKLLQELGIAGHFSSVVGGDTLPLMKPDPAPYRETARRMGIDPAATLMFGDSETDINTAKNAGVPVIAVSFGYTSQHVSAYSPTHIIDHYAEAWDLVMRYL